MYIDHTMWHNYGGFTLDTASISNTSASKTKITLPYTGPLPADLSDATGAAIVVTLQIGLTVKAVANQTATSHCICGWDDNICVLTLPHCRRGEHLPPVHLGRTADSHQGRQSLAMRCQSICTQTALHERAGHAMWRQ